MLWPNSKQLVGAGLLQAFRVCLSLLWLTSYPVKWCPQVITFTFDYIYNCEESITGKQLVFNCQASNVPTDICQLCISNVSNVPWNLFGLLFRKNVPTLVFCMHLRRVTYSKQSLFFAPIWFSCQLLFAPTLSRQKGVWSIRNRVVALFISFKNDINVRRQIWGKGALTLSLG